MKAMLFAIAVGSLALSALVAPAKAETVDCLGVYEAAEVIMQARQSGVPLPKMIEAAEGDPWIIGQIKEAYSYSKMEIDENKKATSAKFAERAYLQCDKSNNQKVTM